MLVGSVGCSDKNALPALAWSGAPKGETASLAVFMVDANSIGKATLTGTYGRKK